jgi:hypothetical protein
VRPPRLRRALAASAAVHVVVLGGLIALAHPRLQAAPAMRVALLGQAGAAAGRAQEIAGGPRSAAGPTERASPVTDGDLAATTRPPPPRASTRAARPIPPRGSGADDSGDGAPAGAEALVSAVQSDVWVLAGSSPPGRGTAGAGAGSAGDAEAVGAGSGTSEASAANAGTERPATGDGTEDPGTRGLSSASLLAALSQRLAWSAARCAPPEVVRTTRHAVPGVPLRFCLDAAGRPSEVGLLGTTGSEVLDRAARECVVPGALPLPPAPGCYTVEVRFPTRG